MQIGRNLLKVKPSLTVTAAAVHFEQLMPACDSLRLAAFRIATARRPQLQKGKDKNEEAHKLCPVR